MTEKQKQELNQARLNEFFGVHRQEDDLRTAYRQMGEQLNMIQEEMGLSKFEAITFLSNMLGAAMRNNNG